MTALVSYRSWHAAEAGKKCIGYFSTAFCRVHNAITLIGCCYKAVLQHYNPHANQQNEQMRTSKVR